MRFSCLLFFFFFLINNSISQKDCCTAYEVPGSNTFNIFTNSGFGNLETLSACSCMATDENNSYWITFECTSSGTFETLITPNNLGADYDFALYATECPCGSNTQITSCSWIGPITNPPFVETGISSDPLTTFGVASNSEFEPTVNLTAGTTYFLVLDNITGNGVGFSIDFAGSAVIGSPSSTPATITPAGPFCEDDPVQTLTATPTGGTWGGAANSSGQVDPMTLGVGSHIVTYTYTPGTGCTESDQITVEINPVPNVSITPAGPFCEDAGIQTLNATPSGGTWGGVANSAGQIDLNALGAGMHTVMYDYTDGNGCSNSDQITIQINGLPTVSITSAGPFCIDSGIQILSASPSGGIWGGASNSVGQIDPNILGVGAHTVTYDYTDGNGCSSSDQITIQINDLPVVSITSAGPFCEDDPVQTLNGTPSGGTWGGAANSVGQIDPNALGVGMHTVTYDYTDGNGCSNSDQITIQINAQPTVSVTPAGPFCEDAGVQTMIGSPSGGIWGGVANSNGQINPTVLGAGMHTVTYDYMDGNGCSNSDQIIVQINGLPTVSITPAGPFCIDSGTQILSASPSGGIWGGASNSVGQIDPNILGVGAHTVTYDYTDGNGCSNSDQITIQINDLPVVSITSAGPFCEDDPIQILNGTPSGGVWGGAANSVGQINPNALGIGMHTVTFDYTDGNGCSNSDQITIQINAQPTVSVTPAGPFCEDAGVQTMIGSPSGGIWGGVANSNGQIDPNILGAGMHTVTYDYTEGNGCSNSDQITIQINGLPSVSITPAGPFCIDAGVQTLTASPSGGIWGGASNSVGQIDPNILGVGSHNVTYDYTDGNGCSNSDQITIQINSLPVVSIASAGPFCSNDPVQTLSASPSGGVWGGTANSVGQIDPSILGAGSHIVTYDYTDGNGCLNSDQIIIQINSIPVVSITPTGPFCEDAGIQTINASPSGGTWGGVANSVGQIDPTVLGAGMHTVTYDYMDGNGCSNSDQIIIQINGLPNVSITPAGPFCEDSGIQTLSASASPSGGTWGGVANSVGQIDPNTLGAGTHTVTYNYTDGNGCSNSDQITIQINSLPVVLIASAGPFCSNDPLQTLIGTPSGGVWGGVANSVGQIDPNTLGAGTHSVSYDYTDSNGCSNSAQIIIQINALPNVSIIPAGPFCEDSGIQTLSASPIGGTWGGVANSVGQIDPNTLGTGSHMVTYDYTDGNGCSDSAQTTIQINSLPIVSITPAGPFCEDSGTQTLSASPSGGTWGGIANSVGQIDPNTLGAGFHTVTYDYTDGNGCSNSAQIIIQINALPNVSITPAGPFCEDSGIQTLSASPSGGTWGGAANSVGQIDPNTLGAGTHTVIYDYTNSNGCSNSAQITIQINSLPIVSITPAGPFCEDAGVQTLSASPSGGIWGGVANSVGQINPNTLGVGTHTVTYSFTNGNNCTGTSQITVQINALPNVSITPAGPFCEDAGVQTLSASPSGGVWGGAANSTGQINPSTLGIGTHQVTYNFTDSNGCSGSDQINISINAIPVVSITPAGPFCEDAGIQTLSASPSGGVWGGAANSIGQIDPQNLGAGIHAVTYDYTDGNGCSNSAQLNIQIDALPIVSVTPAGPFCELDPVQNLIANPPGGTWGGVANSSGQINPQVLGSGSHIVTYSYTDGNGCSDSDQVTIIIYSNPVVNISSIGPFCEDDPIQTLSASPSGGVWGGVANSVGQINPMVLGVGTHTVTYDYIDSNGCSGNDQLDIQINALPIVNIDPIGPFCEDDPIQTLSASPSGGVWGGVSNSIGQINPSTLGAGTHTITYDYTDSNGCSASESITVDIYGLPTATISGSGTTCVGSGQPVNLTITATGAFGLTVNYAIDGVQQAPVTISNSPFTLAATLPGNYSITNVTDANGCSNVGTGLGEVIEVDAPSIINLSTNCAPGNMTYTVTFEVVDGDPNSYMVTGNTGMLSPNPPYLFTSDPIASGSNYSFTVNDVNNCSPQTITGSFFCGCVTQVGTMNLTPIIECGIQTVTAIYDSSSEINDGDDAVEFVLHTNNGTALGTVLATNGAPTFTFNPNSMNYGVTYYISAIMGNENGLGGVDLTDPCLSVAQGTPVTFYQEPSAVLSGTTSICDGQSTNLTIQFTGTPPWNIVYNDGFQNIPVNGINSNPYVFSVFPTNSVVYSLVNIEDLFCEGTVDGTAQITVNPNPSVHISPAGPFCDNDPIQTLSANFPGGTWGGAANVLGQINPMVLGVGTHLVTYNYTDLNGCYGADQINIQINPSPLVTIFPAGPFCEDDPIQFLSAFPTGGTWGGVANSIGQIDPTNLGIGVHLATYQYTDGNGCANSAQLPIEIFALPNVNILPSDDFCESDPVQFLTANPMGGIWGGAVNFNGQINPSNLGAGSHLVTYDYVDGNGCANADQLIIVIHPDPIVTIDPVNAFCISSPIQTLTASPNGGTWGGVANSNGEIDPATLGAGNHLVTYTYVDGNNCTGFDQINIQVLSSPNVTISSVDPFCESDPIQILSASPSGGVWGGAANSNGEIDPTALSSGSHLVSYEFSNGAGCTGEDQIFIEINEDPQVEIFPIDPICEEDGIELLEANPPAGIWGGAANSNGEIDPLILGVGNHIVTYSFTDSEGCSGFDQIEILINSTPQVSIETISPFCTNDPTQTLTGNPTGGIWGGAANSNGEIDPSILGVGFHDVTYGFTTPEGCSNVDLITVEIFDLPTANISGFGTICEGSSETVPLTITTSGVGNVIVNYAINGDQQAPITIANSPYIFNASLSGIYTIIDVEDANVCQNEGTGTAEIIEVGSPSISNFLIECNDINTNYIVSFEIENGDPASYQITGDNGTLSLNAPFIFTSETIPTGTSYFFEVSDLNNCQTTPISGNFFCNCSTDAGTMSPDGISVCEDDTAVFSHNSDEELDGNDMLVFILHSGNGNNLGNIFATNSEPEFSYLPSLQYGVTYYVSAVAGDNDGTGNLDLDDPCLSVSFGTPLVFNPIPSGFLTDNATICEGEPINLIFNLTGNPPFDIVYKEGNTDFILNNILDGYSLNVSPTQTTTYSIVSISDSSNPTCTSATNNAVTITVNSDVFESQTQEICQGESLFLQNDFQTISGFYYDTLAAFNGCDSILQTELLVHSLDTVYLEEETCEMNEVGVFSTIFSNQNGCDSLVIETIKFVESDTTELFDTSCDLNNVGTFEELFSNQNGCDSLVITNISFSESDTVEVEDITCDPNEIGVEMEILVNSEGCDSLIITTISLVFGDTIELNETTCDPTKAGVFETLLINENGCDSLIIETIELLKSDTNYFFFNTCIKSEAGIFEELWTNEVGCDSLIIDEIIFVPSDTIELFDETCDPIQAGIFETLLVNEAGCDSLIIETISLLLTDTTYLNIDSCNPLDTGTVLTQFVNENGCDSLVFETTSLLPPSACAVEGIVTNDQIGCDENFGEITLIIESGEAPFNYNWTGTGIPSNGSGVIFNTNISETISDLSAGNYSITITASNGLETILESEVTQIFSPEITLESIVDYGGFDISCFDASDGMVQLNIENGIPPIDIQWSNGTTSNLVESLNAGWYFVTVIDGNDCVAIDSILLIEPELFQAEFSITNLSCFSQNDGQIIIDPIGGVQPYVYSINGEAFQGSNTFGNLTEGKFEIKIQDANGCEISETIWINAPITIDVDLGEDIFIGLGESTQINAVINVPLDVIDTLIWSGMETVNCQNCPSQVVSPLISTTYSINIIGENGCSDQDEITVFVNKEYDVYIPNAFSPNGDGINDLLMVYAGEKVEKIHSFQIFSRWGESVFKVSDFVPNDPAFGWDGKYRGALSNSGVYVYWAEIEFVDGNISLVKGDVVLIN